jgi:hypothetical protein
VKGRVIVNGKDITEHVEGFQLNSEYDLDEYDIPQEDEVPEAGWGLPVWMRGAPGGVENPFVDMEGVDRRALRIRELVLPPQWRLYGKDRDLRDAKLGYMLLGDAMRNYTMPAARGFQALAQIAQRENGQAQLRPVIARLSENMSEERVAKVHRIAIELFHWTMQEWRIKAAAAIRTEPRPSPNVRKKKDRRK